MGNRQHRFKIGDKVKRINGEFAGMKKGDIGTIVEFSSMNNVRLIEYETRGCVYHDPTMLALIEKPIDKFCNSLPKDFDLDIVDHLTSEQCEELMDFKGIKATLDATIYCSCLTPNLKRVTTSVIGRSTDENTYNFCINCKKENK